MPITGRFAVAGQILGDIAERERIILAILPDPRTCDANGKRPKGGTFVRDDVDLATDDGSWSYVDDLGEYPEGVTLGRIFQYISGPPHVLQELRDHHTKWDAEHGGSGYPGIKPLPRGARVVAKFKVPPGVYSGRTVPCEG